MSLLLGYYRAHPGDKHFAAIIDVLRSKLRALNLVSAEATAEKPSAELTKI